MPDDLTQLNTLLTGPQGTPYENGLWKLQLRIPVDYPKCPPKAAFKTKIYHPNVEESTGSVCLDTLKKDWHSQLTLRDILITISCLLINPNPDSALNAEAGKLIQEDFDAFARKARLMTSIHAVIPASIRAAVAEAKTRGEEKPRIGNDPSPLVDDESDDEDEDEASASKENDPSISPSPVYPPPPGPIRSNNVLGKRPLSDLPISIEEKQSSLSASERNIVANTPNLSSELSTLSFTNPTTTPTSSTSSVSSTSSAFSSSTPASRFQSSTLGERVRSLNADSAVPAPFTFTGIPTLSSNEPIQPPSSKRVCSVEGKENFGEGRDTLRKAKGSLEKPSSAHASSQVSSAVGLGVKNVAMKDNTRKGSTIRTGSKSKPRVGLRRL